MTLWPLLEALCHPALDLSHWKQIVALLPSTDKGISAVELTIQQLLSRVEKDR